MSADETEGIAASENTQGEATENEHPVNHPGKTGHPDAVENTGGSAGGSASEGAEEAVGDGPSGGAPA